MARIAGINIPQNKNVHIGLTYIYGIGNKFSQQICNNLNIPSKKRIHELTEDEICIKLNSMQIKVACVPLPAPGGPKKIKFIYLFAKFRFSN